MPIPLPFLFVIPSCGMVLFEGILESPIVGDADTSTSAYKDCLIGLDDIAVEKIIE
jgi:hypothetical protein